MSETSRILRCFGARVGLHVAGSGRDVDDVVTVAIAQLHAVHVQLTRFERSELTVANADPRATVPRRRSSAAWPPPSARPAS